MEIDRKELKRRARERMALTDPKFWVVTLTYLAMTTGISWLVSLIPMPSGGGITLFFQLLLNLYTAVVQFGLCLWALWTYRQLDPGVNSLMQGFSVAGRVLLMQLGIYVRVLGWYFLISIAVAVPMVSLLVYADYVVGMLALFLFAAVLLAALIFLQLRYALAPYLLADRPDDGPVIPILRSVSLMRGWKMELFKLEFSFIGWDAANFLLSSSVIIFFLAQAGLLTPDAFSNANWRELCLNVIYSAPAVMLSTLVTVPINLRLIPYRAVSRAGFYDARLMAAAQEDPLPNMPRL